LGLCPWQGKTKCRTLTGFTGNFWFGVMTVQDVLNNGQSETGASFLAAAALIHTIKPFENTVYMLGWYSLTKIGHPHPHILLGEFKAHHHLTSIVRIFQGIRYKIGHYLTHSLP